MYELTIHAGHGPYPVGAYGAVGYLNESIEARKVVNEMKSFIKFEDVTVDDNALSANAILRELVKRMNSTSRVVNLSIHLNAYTNSSAQGVRVYLWNDTSQSIKKLANDICSEISNKLGIKNGGLFDGSKLYVIKNTNNPTILIECCFVTSNIDAKKWDASKCAEAIASALKANISNIDCAVDKYPNTPDKVITSGGDIMENAPMYKVQTGAFRVRENAENQIYALKKAGFNDAYIVVE